jgi:hypothetical protein
MTAAYIASALNGRRSGSGWIARCPAHMDTSPSLSLRDSGDKVLVHCFAGCDQRDVVAALRELGLWPERPHPHWTRAERRSYARRRTRARSRAERALLWRSTLVIEYERAKAAAYESYMANPCDSTERVFARTARQLCLAEQLRATKLADAYREAMRRNAAAVERLISKAREDEAHARRCTRFVVEALARKVRNGQ